MPLPEKAEVELTGHFVAPKGQKGEPRVWVTDGPCFQAGSHAVGETKPNGGGFFVEVFVPQGTNLWICGALVPSGATQVTIYGSAPEPVLARGAGEVAVPNIPVVLKKGPPVPLPAQPQP